MAENTPSFAAKSDGQAQISLRKLGLQSLKMGNAVAASGFNGIDLADADVGFDKHARFGVVGNNGGLRIHGLLPNISFHWAIL